MYAEGKRVGGPGFVLFYRPGETSRHRIGLTVPRRVGCSVVRNRIKRRLREVFRMHRDALGRKALDIVVNVIGADVPSDRPGLETSFLKAATAASAGKGRPPRPAGERRPTRGKPRARDDKRAGTPGASRGRDA